MLINDFYEYHIKDNGRNSVRRFRLLVALYIRLNYEIMNMKKKIKHKKYGKGGHRNLSDHFEAYFPV